MISNTEAGVRPFLLMVSMALVVSFAFQGTRGLYETSEGRYAECAREMVETGQYLEPTLNYRPHWTKPPLTYWAIAGGIKLLGANEWGVRFYNSVASFLTTLVVASLGFLLWGWSAGVLAGIIYASSPFPAFGGYAVTIDTLLTLWEVIAVFCYLKATHDTGKKDGRRWIITMWVFLGLGFLTKGPPSLLPLLPILVWHFLKRPEAKLADPVGLALFAGTGFWWYLVVGFRHPELFSYFIGHEVVDRVASNTMHNHEWYKPFTMYLPALALGAGPWLYWGAVSFWRKRLFHPAIIFRYFRKKKKESFLLLWLLLPLIVFFLVKSRLYLYVLPLYAPIALAIGAGMLSLEGKGRTVSRAISVAVVTALFLVGIKAVSSFYPNKNNMKPLFKLCQAVNTDGARFAAFNEPKLYGLQFYLGGNLKRITLTGGEAWADGSLKDIVKEARKGVLPHAYVLISQKKKAHLLVGALKEFKVPFRTAENKYWLLCVIQPLKVANHLLSSPLSHDPRVIPGGSTSVPFQELGSDPLQQQFPGLS